MPEPDRRRPVSGAKRQGAESWEGVFYVEHRGQSLTRCGGEVRMNRSISESLERSPSSTGS